MYLSQLTTDVLIIIASYHSDLWYWLYRYNIHFKKYAESYEGRILYKQLFTIKSYDKTRHILTWTLFNVLHRDDLPALMTLSNTQQWYQNGILQSQITTIDGERKRFWYKDGKLVRCEKLNDCIYKI